MNWTWYLFSFKGRINRAKWWLAELVLIGWQLFCLIAYFGLSLATHTYLPDENIGLQLGPDEISVLIGRLLDGSFSLVDLVALAANLFAVTTFFWMFLATSIKRLHDRDRSGWWIVPFFGLLSFFSNIQERLGESIFTFPVDLALFVLCIWGLVELGFLPGSPGANRFGPNPLGKQQGRPRGEPKSGISTSGRDQNS
jgi:uncharacterized membrane protein YhaH (DUF805 family)